MEIVIIGVVFLIIIIGLFFILKDRFQKESQTASEELRLFKKEKEYYQEAMIVMTLDRKILFANLAAKNLFHLNEENKAGGFEQKVELKVGKEKPADFFDAVFGSLDQTNTSLQLPETYLIVGGKRKKVDLFVDTSDLGFDQTITCVIDGEPRREEALTHSSAKSNGEDNLDILTGLPTQFNALRDINALIVESQKEGKHFFLFLLGIDHFHDIQISMGHTFGNQILKKMSQFFAKKNIDNVQTYRMEYNKFLMVFTSIKTEQKAREEALNLISGLRNYCQGNNAANITASIGIVHFPEHGINASKLIDHAYIALDNAQQESQSNVEYFSSEYQMIHKDELQINDEIKKGLENEEFVLFYQPIIDLQNESVVGAEALVRWHHPKLGLISPDKFLNIAEKTGLIVDIGEYVFKAAIIQHKEWSKLSNKQLKITINLSFKEMQVEKLIEKLTTLFKEYQAYPEDFILDISESSIMENRKKAARDLRLLKDMGFTITLDHFGAESSSLHELQALPLSVLKIDRSLIFDLEASLEHQNTVKALIGVAHTLGYQASAEGVETAKEVSLLTSLKCDYAQGYYYSRAVSAEEFEGLLK